MTCGIHLYLQFGKRNLDEELDDSHNYEMVVDFLNGKEVFLPFGARLALFIAKKIFLPSTESKTIISALAEQCEKSEVVISEMRSS